MRNDETYLARIKERMDKTVAPKTNKTINYFTNETYPPIYMICGLCNERICCGALVKLDIYFPYSEYIYCDTCKVMYYNDTDCASYSLIEHGEEAYGHYITQWQDMETDIVYEGMPVFENAEDWIQNYDKIKVLKLWCYDGSCQCPIDNEPSYI